MDWNGEGPSRKTGRPLQWLGGRLVAGPGELEWMETVEKFRWILEMQLAEPGMGRLEEENGSECLDLA